MQEKTDRACKRCLIREMAGNTKVYDTVLQYIENLEEVNRTVASEYEQRLAKCKECERLLDGMCRACGCYVEIRAAVKGNTCPYDCW